MLIFVIEDDDLLRECLGEFLEDAGHETRLAANETEAMNLIRSDERADVMVTDFNLGGALDGVDICEQMKAKNAACRVLLISGQPQLATYKLGSRGCGDRFLMKPFMRADLISAIDSFSH